MNPIKSAFEVVCRHEGITDYPYVTVRGTFVIQRSIKAEVWDDPKHESLCRQILTATAINALRDMADELAGCPCPSS